MEAINNLLLFTGVAFLFTHELDAIRQHEWRFFFVLTPIEDNAAYQIFTAVHIPLFIIILWNLPSLWFQVGFDTFLIIHLVLHWLLRNHSKITFNNWFSRLYIFGGALFGAMHLALIYRR